ncbi:MAG: VOC family protein [Ferruginibacter sp.]
MLAVNPYLNFPGNTEEAFNFYRSVFGGEFSLLQRFSDTSHGEMMAPAERSKIMHIALPLAGGATLMGTDALESQGHSLQMGNNFFLTLHTESEAEADTLFAKLSDGARILLPLQQMFWGAYFGMLTDKFGIQWMITYEQPKN